MVLQFEDSKETAIFSVNMDITWEFRYCSLGTPETELPKKLSKCPFGLPIVMSLG